VLIAIAVSVALAAGAALAQDTYRWIDEQGRVRYTDTPPPPGAKGVQKTRRAAGGTVETSQPPFELSRATKDFPVTLYTSPDCKQACARAREALNKRGVPFTEVQVWDSGSHAELKKLSGDTMVPVLKAGPMVQKGFEQGAFDSLLDSAGYPKAGVLPARAQAAPAPPAGYLPPEQREGPKPAVEPEAPAAPPAPAGPYAPKPPTKK
jgi:glutaredoxin